MAAPLPTLGPDAALRPPPRSRRVPSARWKCGPVPGAGLLRAKLTAAALLLALLAWAALPGALAQASSNTTAASTSSNSTATRNTTTITSSGSISSLPAKWTFLVYMLADNNLECFGLLDMLVGFVHNVSGRLLVVPGHGQGVVWPIFTRRRISVQSYTRRGPSACSYFQVLQVRIPHPAK